MSSGKIGWYVHHHGNGHLQQANRLIPYLNSHKPILFCAVESFAKRLREAFPRLQVYVLPEKYSKPRDRNTTRTFANAFEGTPYAGSATQRAAFFTSILQKERISLFISDVSAELTILARGAGVKTVMFHLHGNVMKDPTQVFAYECAAALFAPFPKALEDSHYAYEDKTYYLGWLAPYGPPTQESEPDDTLTIIHSHHQWVVKMVNALATQVKHIHVIGTTIDGIPNVTSTQYVNRLVDKVKSKNVIIAGGNNLVGEMVQAGKKIMIAPEPRPYEEQYYKAKAMEREGWAVCLDFTSYEPSENEILNAYAQLKQLKPIPTQHSPDDIARRFTQIIEVQNEEF
ncbi:hypothetical protein [Alteromonas sp. ASW11-130]|uniref:hypothetical protein n=1 Tax=Alteromonas sp. ASW11-130 TaxID=3015775 RepID=UPI0022428204|nr:hypothetical protein [Alteromonas sp. ASW11-130]MCW8092339.1 hypothetical protein [Alteromonas sp. ASW11-130]